jgi:hypothetical protein
MSTASVTERVPFAEVAARRRPAEGRWLLHLRTRDPLPKVQQFNPDNSWTPLAPEG